MENLSIPLIPAIILIISFLILTGIIIWDIIEIKFLKEIKKKQEEVIEEYKKCVSSYKRENELMEEQNNRLKENIYLKDRHGEYYETER